MTTQVDVNLIMACLSPEMIDKLEYAGQAYIKELLILKKDEEEKGNVEQYSWLNIGEYHYSSNPIKELAEEMFMPRIETDNIRLSVITDYFVIEDVPILKNFAENYYVHMYNYTQENCETMWKRQMLGRRNIPEKYLNMICELTMYFYMDLNENFVIDNLYNQENTNNVELK